MASKIAILGSTGFLGNLLSNQLEKDGYTVLRVTRQDLDIRNYQQVRDWLKLNKPDVVINCATATGNASATDIVYDDLVNNFDIFLNFYNNSNLFGKYINIGSGAEFDMSKNIDVAHEEDILTSTPSGSYGYSKNMISRLILNKDNFYTLRLFGCFHSSEKDFRLLKRCLNSKELVLQNKMFDYISFQDFYLIVKHYVNNQELSKDINCVYQEKYDLLSILDTFISYHNLNTKVTVLPERGINYTGSGDRLSEIGLKLEGLDEGLLNYVKG